MCTAYNGERCGKCLKHEPLIESVSLSSLVQNPTSCRFNPVHPSFLSPRVRFLALNSTLQVISLLISFLTTLPFHSLAHLTFPVRDRIASHKSSPSSICTREGKFVNIDFSIRQPGQEFKHSRNLVTGRTSKFGLLVNKCLLTCHILIK